MVNLTEEQKETVRTWVRQGLKVYEVQNLLESEFGLSMTFMEVHMLLGDIEAALQAPPKETPPPTAPESNGPLPEEEENFGDESWEEEALPAGGGKVSIDVDNITQPGAIVSGKATFSDGQKASWLVDQMGRLGFIPEQKGYRPTPQDMQEFQMALQNALARYGF